MSCTKIEKLLPLYVEDDLPERDRVIVRAHLSTCDYCRGQAEAFRASQDRLHNFAAPEFDAEFYEQIRAAVLSEITAAPRARPSVFRNLQALFAARPALAPSLALLVLACALSFGLYHSLVKREDSNALPALESSMGDFDPYQFTEASEQKIKDDAVVAIHRPIVTAANVVPKRPRPVSPGSVRPQGSQGIETATAAAMQVQGIDDTHESAASQTAVARMEIQTSDPNIRIIWLGRKASE